MAAKKKNREPAAPILEAAPMLEGKIIPELKEICKSEGLPTTGKKQDLIDRIKDARKAKARALQAETRVPKKTTTKTTRNTKTNATTSTTTTSTSTNTVPVNELVTLHSILNNVLIKKECTPHAHAHAPDSSTNALAPISNEGSIVVHASDSSSLGTIGGACERESEPKAEERPLHPGDLAMVEQQLCVPAAPDNDNSAAGSSVAAATGDGGAPCCRRGRRHDDSVGEKSHELRDLSPTSRELAESLFTRLDARIRGVVSRLTSTSMISVQCAPPAPAPRAAPTNADGYMNESISHNLLSLPPTRSNSSSSPIGNNPATTAATTPSPTRRRSYTHTPSTYPPYVRGTPRAGQTPPRTPGNNATSISSFYTPLDLHGTRKRRRLAMMQEATPVGRKPKIPVGLPPFESPMEAALTFRAPASSCPRNSSPLLPDGVKINIDGSSPHDRTVADRNSNAHEQQHGIGENEIEQKILSSSQLDDLSIGAACGESTCMISRQGACGESLPGHDNLSGLASPAGGRKTEIAESADGLGADEIVGHQESNVFCVSRKSSSILSTRMMTRSRARASRLRVSFSSSVYDPSLRRRSFSRSSQYQNGLTQRRKSLRASSRPTPNTPRRSSTSHELWRRNSLSRASVLSDGSKPAPPLATSRRSSDRAPSIRSNSLGGTHSSQRFRTSLDRMIRRSRLHFNLPQRRCDFSARRLRGSLSIPLGLNVPTHQTPLPRRISGEGPNGANGSEELPFRLFLDGEESQFQIASLPKRNSSSSIVEVYEDEEHAYTSQSVIDDEEPVYSYLESSSRQSLGDISTLAQPPRSGTLTPPMLRRDSSSAGNSPWPDSPLPSMSPAPPGGLFPRRLLFTPDSSSGEGGTPPSALSGALTNAAGGVIERPSRSEFLERNNNNNNNNDNNDHESTPNTRTPPQRFAFGSPNTTTSNHIIRTCPLAPNPYIARNLHLDSTSREIDIIRSLSPLFRGGANSAAEADQHSPVRLFALPPPTEEQQRHANGGRPRAHGTGDPRHAPAPSHANNRRSGVSMASTLRPTQLIWSDDDVDDGADNNTEDNNNEDNNNEDNNAHDAYDDDGDYDVNE